MPRSWPSFGAPASSRRRASCTPSRRRGSSSDLSSLRRAGSGLDRLSIMLDLMAGRTFSPSSRPSDLHRTPPSETLAPDELRLFEEVQRCASARTRCCGSCTSSACRRCSSSSPHGVASRLDDGHGVPDARHRRRTITAPAAADRRGRGHHVRDPPARLLRDEFGSDDLPPALFTRAEGIRLVSCLAPADPRVNTRLVPASTTRPFGSPLGRLCAVRAPAARRRDARAACLAPERSSGGSTGTLAVDLRCPTAGHGCRTTRRRAAGPGLRCDAATPGKGAPSRLVLVTAALAGDAMRLARRHRPAASNASGGPSARGASVPSSWRPLPRFRIPARQRRCGKGSPRR